MGAWGRVGSIDKIPLSWMPSVILPKHLQLDWLQIGCERHSPHHICIISNTCQPGSLWPTIPFLVLVCQSSANGDLLQVNYTFRMPEVYGIDRAECKTSKYSISVHLDIIPTTKIKKNWQVFICITVDYTKELNTVLTITYYNYKLCWSHPN